VASTGHIIITALGIIGLSGILSAVSSSRRLSRHHRFFRLRRSEPVDIVLTTSARAEGGYGISYLRSVTAEPERFYRNRTGHRIRLATSADPRIGQRRVGISLGGRSGRHRTAREKRRQSPCTVIPERAPSRTTPDYRRVRNRGVSHLPWRILGRLLCQSPTGL
jgi:hypothetical protein